MSASPQRRSTTATILLSIAMLALIGCVQSVCAGTYRVPTSSRSELDLSATWKFYKGDVPHAQSTSQDDSSWGAVDLPHTWNNLDGQDGGANYYRGIGWYRKRYSVPAEYAGRRLFLQFDGANAVADVWVNGTYLGQHRGGYARFRFDATAALKVGAQNLIAVKVDNAAHPDIAPLAGDFTFFGGLYRGVRLLVTDPLHVQPLDFGGPGVYLQQTKVSAKSADLRVIVKLANRHAIAKQVVIVASVVDAANSVVSTTSSFQRIAANADLEVVATMSIANPHLWNGRVDPYLHTVYVEIRDGPVVVDLVAQPLGLRFFNVDAERGFALNGKYLDLHGVNRHQDRLDQGSALADADHDEDFAMIAEIGATAVRLAHYQHAQRFYDLCDEHGMVVWAEIPLIDKLTDTEAFFDNARQQMTELIRQNYNHASILFWGIGNEQRQDDAPTNRLLKQLSRLTRAEDPTRLSAYAHCCSSETGALTQHTDVIGYNAYFGWYHATYADFAAWADKLHAARPSRKIAISEYGAGGSIAQHADDPAIPEPNGTFHPEEYQSRLHEAHWKAMQGRHFLWGKWVWNMFDFASDARIDGDRPGRNDKGLVTYDRKTRKDAFYWYKANWRDWSEADGRVVHITSRRQTSRADATVDIGVYSNAGSVELKINGESLGSRSSDDRIFVWRTVALRSGANSVEAIGTKNGITAVDAVTWTRAEADR